jgi:hypothetical protein
VTDVQVGNVTVRATMEQRGIATSICYFLNSHSVSAKLNLTGDSPDVEVSASEVASRMMSIKTEEALCARFGLRCVSTSDYFSIFPFISGVIFGPVAALVVLGMSWLAYGKVPKTLESLQKSMKRGIPTTLSDKFDQSLLKKAVPTGLGFVSLACVDVRPAIAMFILSLPSNVQLTCNGLSVEVQTGGPLGLDHVFKLLDTVLQGSMANFYAWKLYESVMKSLFPSWQARSYSRVLLDIASFIGVYSEPKILGISKSAMIEFFSDCPGVLGLRSGSKGVWVDSTLSVNTGYRIPCILLP